MRTFILSVLISGLFVVPATAQKLTAGDFMSLVSYDADKTDSYLSRRGFKKASLIESTQEDAYLPKLSRRNPDTTFRCVTELSHGSYTSFKYQTASKEECSQILKELNDGGFVSADEANGSKFFQKRDITVKLDQYNKEEQEVFSFIISKKQLPVAQNIRYAEDLTVFESHENLVHVFGEENVSKDRYFFSEKDFNRCSILFPNTSGQVVFFWKDEKTMTGLAYLMLGGSERANGSVRFNELMPLNDWPVHSNIRVGMTVQQVLDLVNEDFQIYGWNSEFAGSIVPCKTRAADFNKLGVQFVCGNCSVNPAADADKITAKEAVKEGLRLKIMFLMIFPERGRSTEAATAMGK